MNVRIRVTVSPYRLKQSPAARNKTGGRSPPSILANAVRLAELRHLADEAHQLVGEAGLVVVPDDELDLRAVHDGGEPGVEHAAEGAAHEVRGDQRLVAVAEVLAGRGLHRRVHFFLGGGALKLAGQVHNGHVRCGHADGETVELALELRNDQRKRAGRAGGGGHHGKQLQANEAEAIKISYRDGEAGCSISVKKGKNKNITLEIIGQEIGKKLQSIDTPYSALVTGLAGIPSEERYVTPYALRKAAARGDSNSVFRNILLQLKQQGLGWTKFQQQINRIFPNYEINVEFDDNSNEVIDCNVISNGNVFPIDCCGTGVLQAIQIFSYINLFNPKLLLLDEPDSHLHPNNQKALAKELVSLADSGLAVITSTHSKHLVEALIDDSTFIWMRQGKLEPATSQYELKALLDVGALSIGERISNPKYIFLTEDDEHDLLKTLLLSSGYNQNEFEIESYSGCSQIGTAKALIKQLRKSNPKSRIAIHRDRDFLSDEEISRYREQFKDVGVQVFIPTGNDLEAYFLSSEHISASCGIDIEEAEDILEVAFKNIKDKLTQKYVDLRHNNERKSMSPKSPGQLSIEANKMLTGPHCKAVHGKTLSKAIKSELQNRRHYINIFAQSPFVETAELRDLWVKPKKR